MNQGNDVAKAQALAMHAHQGQRDKSGNPYVDHLRAVADACSSDEAKIVVWLHDSVEDLKLTLKEIEEAFGGVSCYEARRRRWRVWLMSHPPNMTYEDYLQRMLDSGDKVVLEVKIADMSHNLGRVEQIEDREERERLVKKYTSGLAKLKRM